MSINMFLTHLKMHLIFLFLKEKLVQLQMFMLSLLLYNFDIVIWYLRRMMLIYLVCVFAHGAKYALKELTCAPICSGTGGPPVGSSPAVSNNKASGAQPATNEVYLVWDDEAMSMVCF